MPTSLRLPFQRASDNQPGFGRQARKIATSTLWQIASQATMAALSILVMKFVAVALTQELAGIYNSSYGFLQLFGILADFGLYVVTVREVSRATNKEKVLGALIVLRCCTLVLSLGSALLLVWLLPQWRGTPLPLSVTIASLVPSFTLLAGILRTVFQVKYKMHFVFIAEVTQRVITVVLIGLVIVLGIRGSTDERVLYYILGVGGLGAAVLFIISLIYGSKLIRIRPSFDRALLKKLALGAAPYGVAFVFVALFRQFDTTLIAILRDDFEIQNAYYGFVLRMADVGFVIPSFLMNSTLPILSEEDSQGKDTRDLLGKTMIILLFLGTTATLFSALWSRPLIQLLTTEQYLSTALHPGSDTALRLIALPLFLNGFVTYGFYILLTKHAWRRLVVTLLLGGVLSLSMNLYLIPIYGFVGAAFTTIVVHLMLAAILTVQSLKVMPLIISKVQILQWIAYTILLAGTLWLLRPFLVSEVATIVGLASATFIMGVLLFGMRLHRTLAR